MRFLKFVMKTIVVTVVCTFIFNTILDKVIDSEAKGKLTSTSNEISRLVSFGILNTLSSKDKDKNDNKDNINNIQDDNKDSKPIDTENQNVKTEDISKGNTQEVKENVNESIYIPRNIIENKNDNFIFIGDSRTVAYKELVNVDNYDFVTFIAEISKGFDWFNETALEKLNTRFNTTDLKYSVVLNLGVNDLQNVDKYIEEYNKLVLNNPNHNFFVVSVNKVDTEEMIKKGYNRLENIQIEEFNTKLKNSLSDKIHFIDTYSYFKNKNLETTDGLHYTDEASTEILNYISNYIKSI